MTSSKRKRNALRHRFRRWAWMFLTVCLALPPALVLLYRYVPPPITPLMLIRLTEGHDLDRQWVDWGLISSHARESVVAAEDNLFCTHGGFDLKSLRDAAASYVTGERAGGGSTISMQTAKNLFLWPSRSIVRKALEVPLTVLIELLWPKQRILEVYLNIAEWGPGLYGIERAALNYYGRPAYALTPGQAARLAAVLPSPLQWRPVPASRYIAQRAETIQTRVEQLGPLLACVRH